MTDKQVIVDGIDVSGCDFLAKEDDYCSYSGEYRAYKGQCGCSDEEMCKDHPNCFYKKALKQLKRKEQECEKAKQNAQDTYDLWQALIESFDILQGEKIKLEQECERLEGANNTLTITREKLLGDLCIVEESLKDYTEHYNRQCEELDKLRITLTEIKPILELYANSKIGEEQLDGTYKIIVKESKVLGDTYITFDPRPAKQALQKISKCEV